MADNKRVANQLNGLRRLCVAGEKGFEVVAANVSNRGLKVLLKSYAQQRASFVIALQDEIKALGGSWSERRSVRGVIHRGRINIFAALTIGPLNVEKVVLKEARRGENAVVKAYENVLDKELPASTRELLSRQLEAIRATREEVELLIGNAEKQLVVRLFDTVADAELAGERLEAAGFQRGDISAVSMNDLEFYEGEGSKVDETVISGAFGGALWGTLIGVIAGVTATFVPQMTGDPMVIWGGTTLAGLVFGALFGAILGLWIGLGISEADVYVYDNCVRFGAILLRLLTSSARSVEATHILYEVNAAARARARSQAVAASDLQRSEIAAR